MKWNEPNISSFCKQAQINTWVEWKRHNKNTRIIKPLTKNAHSNHRVQVITSQRDPHQRQKQFNLLTANAAAVNNMSSIKSRSERTYMPVKRFHDFSRKTPPSTPFRAKSKVRQMENMLETVLGLSNENIPSYFILTIWDSHGLELEDESKSPLALGAKPPCRSVLP